MVATFDSETIRRKSLKYLWMHNRDWVQMAEDGEPSIIVGGKGVKVFGERSRGLRCQPKRSKLGDPRVVAHVRSDM